MIRRLTAFAVVAILSVAPLSAQEFAETAPGQVIAKYESDGGRNIPNFAFDPVHTAGGHFQITDTNWQHYAQALGIDLSTYPNAMSAPEQLQGQVAGKMWAEQGFMPWSCCNKQLREHLGQQPAILKVRAARPKPVARAPVTTESPHNWNVFAADSEGGGGQSFLITGQSE